MKDNRVDQVNDISKKLFKSSISAMEKDIIKKYFEITGSIFLILDHQFNIVFINNSGSKILKFKKNDIIGQNWLKRFIPKKLHKEILFKFEKISKNNKKKSVHFESPVMVKNGEGRIIDWNIAILNGNNKKDNKNKDGKNNKNNNNIKNNFYLLSGEDISERRRAEEALLESYELYHVLFEQAAESIILIECETGNILDFNNKAFFNLGFTRNEFKNLNITDIKLIESAEKIVDLMKEIITNGLYTFEAKLKKKNGKFIDALVTTSSINLNDKVFIACIWRDITERKIAETALRESEERLRSIFESSPDAITVSDLEGTILSCNKQTAKLHKYDSIEELVGTNGFDHIHKDDHEKIFENTKRIFEIGIMKNMEYTFITKNGDPFPGEFSLSIIKDSSGEPIGFIGITKNISERKIAEEKLIEERNRAELYLDLLSHDINNINQAIMTTSEILLIKQEIPNEMKKYIENLQEQSKRMADLVSKVRKLTDLRENECVMKKIDLKQIIEQSIDNLVHIYNDRQIKINHSFKNNRVFVNGNDLIQDIFDNILVNAIKFNKNDHIKIDIVQSLIENGEYWKIEFKDYGPGVPDDMKERIFQRHHKGDDIEPGIGLGLTLVNEIVTKCGGKVWVEDKLKGDRTKGSNFVVLLPIIPEGSV